MAKSTELTSPLAIDRALMAELGVKDDPVTPHTKLAFLQAQLSEMQNQFWRNRVDVIHANRLMQSDVEAIRNKGFQNIDEHKNYVKQFLGGIQMLRKLIDELRKEYPELQAED
jgi:hypothetical protein